MTNRGVAFRSSLENPPDGPVVHITRVLRSGEEIHIDAVLRDQQEAVDVLVDETGLVDGPERCLDVNRQLVSRRS